MKNKMIQACLVFMKLCGLYPGTVNPSHESRCCDKVFKLFNYFWSFFVAIFVLYYTIVDALFLFQNYTTELKEPNFVQLMMVGHRILYHGKAFAIVVCMMFIARKIPAILVTTEQTTSHLTSSNARKITLYGAFLIVFALVSFSAAPVVQWFSFSNYIARIQRFVPSFTWETYTMSPVLVGRVPFYFFPSLYSVGLAIAIAADLLPILLCSILALVIAFKYRILNEKLTTLAKWHQGETYSSKELHFYLSSLRKDHLELSHSVQSLDRSFSIVLLLVYFCDLLGIIACISLSLEIGKKGTMLGGNLAKSMTPTYITMITISSVCFLLITFIGIWLHESAHGALAPLDDISVLMDNQSGRLDAIEFFNRLEGEPITLSAGGLIPLTRDFLVAAFGLLLTYAILVYQIQDGKHDMEELVAKTDIPELAERIGKAVFGAINVNGTV